MIVIMALHLFIIFKVVSVRPNKSKTPTVTSKRPTFKLENVVSYFFIIKA